MLTVGGCVVSVTEGEVSFKLKVSSKMSPEVQVLAYAILPSESVIAHSAEFSTETCFDNKVSQRGSSSALCLMKEEILL